MKWFISTNLSILYAEHLKVSIMYNEYFISNHTACQWINDMLSALLAYEWYDKVNNFMN